MKTDKRLKNETTIHCAKSKMAAPIESDDEAKLRAILTDSSSDSDFEGFKLNDLFNARTTISINQAETDLEPAIDVQNGWLREDSPPLNSPFVGITGLNIELPENSTVLDFFNLLLLMKYRRSINVLSQFSRQRKWEPVNIDEMKVFIALVLAMGLTEKPDIVDYWSKDETLFTPFFGKNMTKDRFLLILGRKPEPIDRLAPEGHYPMYIPAKPGAKRAHPQRDCVACNVGVKERNGHKRRQTIYMCGKCERALCIPDCFRLYHTHKHYKRFLNPQSVQDSSSSDSLPVTPRKVAFLKNLATRLEIEQSISHTPEQPFKRHCRKSLQTIECSSPTATATATTMSTASPSQLDTECANIASPSQLSYESSSQLPSECPSLNKWEKTVTAKGIKKVLLSKGYNVLIPQTQLSNAILVGTCPRRLTIQLLECFFRREQLAVSNATGKRQAHNSLTPTKPLNQLVLQAILEFVLTKFKKDSGEPALSVSNFNSIVNSNLLFWFGKTPELRESWESCIKPVQQTVAERFQRLKLKNIPFRTIDPVESTEIDLLQRHLRELFPDLDLTKLQKAHTKKVDSYQTWLEKHCRQRQYNFQIRKCDNLECCPPSTLSRDMLNWLPEPVLDGTKNHYQAYDEIKDHDTTEEDRREAETSPVTMQPPMARCAYDYKASIEAETTPVTMQPPMARIAYDSKASIDDLQPLDRPPTYENKEMESGLWTGPQLIRTRKWNQASGQAPNL
ncbi:PGBD4-like protein [Mya arenaria]|uniref:PGBD4-like protein n=1 Tax=Mya arenaria TaxID=6604 RepID=A0ABY7ERN0_MYAAR|nr:PGBD4-like protein [Mya arenaria]